MAYRDIDIQIPVQRRLAGFGPEWVTQEPLPEGRVPIEGFLAAIDGIGVETGEPPLSRYDRPARRCPTIEAMSRKDMIRFPDQQYDSQATSLFYRTVHQCFSKHYGLALSPEVLLFLVVHEVAQAAKRDPEAFRPVFTTRAASEGKDLIQVLHNGLRMGDPSSPWHEAIQMLGQGLADRVPSDLLGLSLPDFSTHTPETMATTLVGFMAAASPYYDYRVRTKCGIPRVRLMGEPEDWAKLAAACHDMAAVLEPCGDELKPFFEDLLPVTLILADQAAGSPVDQEFWQSIYKHKSMSGSDAMTGWITAFMAYENDGKGNLRPKERYDRIERASVPPHVSSVDFVWEYLSTELPMRFVGGILGVDDEDGFAAPRLGWAVLHR